MALNRPSQKPDPSPTVASGLKQCPHLLWYFDHRSLGSASVIYTTLSWSNYWSSPGVQSCPPDRSNRPETRKSPLRGGRESPRGRILTTALVVAVGVANARCQPPARPLLIPTPPPVSSQSPSDRILT